ncbi:MAG: hypothetical protein ACM3MG_13465 [Bacillota bacterium]
MMSVLLVLASFLPSAHAADSMTIIDVRRNITLSDEETPYKDFYIAAGPDSGLKKNLVVTAVRKINIRDAAGANSFGEIAVPVGQLKVIAIYDKIAVAREFNLLSRDELPMLEQVGIMTGDKIDLRGAFVDTSKPKPKRKVAEENSTTTTTTTVTTVVTTAPVLHTPQAAASQAAAPAPMILTSPEVAKISPEKELQSPLTPAAPEKALTQTPVSKGEKLEKVADSGNNSGHE